MLEADATTRRGVAWVGRLSQRRQAELAVVWSSVARTVREDQLDTARSAFLAALMAHQPDRECIAHALRAVGMWNPLGLEPPR